MFLLLCSQQSKSYLLGRRPYDGMICLFSILMNEQTLEFSKGQEPSTCFYRLPMT